ncbi:MAG: hypothetical protein FWC96_03230 [Oscillospiraceae bacterium]|nr:hypothetical protein [Oscillospiraceae bacterium]
MDAVRQTVIDIIQRMPNDQVMKVLSFAKFVENEEVEAALLRTEAEEAAGIKRYTPMNRVFERIDHIIDAEAELWLSPEEEEEIVYLIKHDEIVDGDAVLNDILSEQE